MFHYSRKCGVGDRFLAFLSVHKKLFLVATNLAQSPKTNFIRPSRPPLSTSYIQRSQSSSIQLCQLTFFCNHQSNPVAGQNNIHPFIRFHPSVHLIPSLSLIRFACASFVIHPLSDGALVQARASWQGRVDREPIMGSARAPSRAARATGDGAAPWAGFLVGGGLVKARVTKIRPARPGLLPNPFL